MLELSCCEVVERMENNVREGWVTRYDRAILDRKFPYVNRCSLILKHLNECLGYNDFFEELATQMRKSPSELLSYFSNLREDVILYLGVILTKDLRDYEIYDRLFNCIPTIVKGLEYSLERYSEPPLLYLLGSIVDIDALKDYLFCTHRIDLFRRISPNVCHYEFAMMCNENTEPENNILSLCTDLRSIDGATIRDVTPIIQNRERYLTVCTDVGYFVEYPNNQNVYTKYLSFELRSYGGGPKESRLCKEFSDIGSFSAKDHLGEPLANIEIIFISAKDIDAMLDFAHQHDFPVFFNKTKITLTRKRCAKSARK